MPEGKKKRRWLQFSLRTMLAVTTLVAVYLGLLMHGIRARGNAIRVIDANGGTYGYKIVGSAWLRKLINDEKCFYEPIRVSFGPLNQGYDPDNPFEDHDLDLMIDHLNVFYRFEHLGLDQSNITDDGLAHLRRLRKIIILDIPDTSVSDKGLMHLKSLLSLRTLDLRGTRVTDEGVAKLQAALPNCEIER
jgi:hypothetical protein